MKILPSRRWKGPKSEAVAPKDYQIDQSSDRRVQNFMKINSENLQKMATANKNQSADSNVKKQKNDSNFINPTGNSKESLISNLLGGNNNTSHDIKNTNSSFTEKKDENKKVLIEEVDTDSYNDFKKQIEVQNQKDASNESSKLTSRGYD